MSEFTASQGRLIVTEPRPRLAESYRLTEKALTVDGETFPWLISEDGPRIELGADPHIHVLWIPVLVDAIVPPITEESK